MITVVASSWFQRIRAKPAPGLAVLVLVLTATSVQAQVRVQGAGPGRPSIAAEVVPGSLVRYADTVSFRISVEVPGQHHGYLDKGDDGFFIPLSFSFPDIDGTDSVVEMTSVPPGARDDQVRAQVLRGRGEFAFQITPPPEAGAEAAAMLRYQICDDVTQRCYPPARITIPIVLSRLQRRTADRSRRRPPAA